MDIKETQFNVKKYPTTLEFWARHSVFITIGFVLLLVVALYQLVRPIVSQAQLQEETLSELENSVDLRERYLDEITTYINESKKISTRDTQRLASLIPEEKDIPGLLVQFEYLALENGFILGSVVLNPELKAEEDTGSISRLGVTLTLTEGSYETLKQFLDDIETNLRLFDVISISFDQSVDSLSISLITYYIPS